MAKMTEQTRIVVVVVVMVALAGGFWLLLLSPKRDKAGELSEQVTTLQSEVASVKQEVASSLAAKQTFPENYRHLVELGAAVPSDAQTPSLVVQLSGLSSQARTSFQSIALGAGGGGAPTSESTTGNTAQLPLGAGVGPSGFAAMPYSLAFEGGFFDITKFIHSLDGLVTTKSNGEVDAHGRLVMIDSFSLVPVSGEGQSNGVSAAPGDLSANFSVNTYVTPPGQGLTAGATESGPAETTMDLP
jgi:Tfp pilus assembly protein PilO